MQFALLDTSRQLACMKLGSSRKYQPMQYCWVHTSQLLGYLVYTCHFPIDIQTVPRHDSIRSVISNKYIAVPRHDSIGSVHAVQCGYCNLYMLHNNCPVMGVYCIFVYRNIIYLVSCYITMVIKLHPNPGLILTVL